MFQAADGGLRRAYTQCELSLGQAIGDAAIANDLARVHVWSIPDQVYGSQRRRYYAVMKRTTISLPDDLAQALTREARRRSVPASAVARDALSGYLGMGNPYEPRELPFAALGRSGHRSTARDMEHLLEAEWVEHAGDR